MQQFARLFEIDLRGKEGRAPDLVLLAPAMQQRQRRRQRGPGHAIADRVHRFDIEALAHMVDGIDLGAHVIVPDDILHAGIGRFPADHEHRHALRDGPAHEALLLVQIEDVEAVDPRREDDERGFQHRVGGGRILDQLEQIRFVDDLAGCGRDVLAQCEGVGIRVAQLAAPQIGEQVLHSLDQVFPARFQRSFEHDRIGHREIRRARRFGDGARGEAQLFALVRRQPVHIVDHGERLFGKEQIGLVDQREGGMGAPARIGKPLVL